MIKLGKDGYVNKESPATLLVAVYFILFIFTVMLCQGRKPIFVIMMVIVVAAAVTLLIKTIYNSQPTNLLIDRRGVTIQGILRP